ncbi:MAG: palindromic element RPE4 domain-containing protein [Gammaproteobacteria bacterium]|nr:palindromic element RPE4 domain-containing protein [Gammaproteobacteria bacterium]
MSSRGLTRCVGPAGSSSVFAVTSTLDTVVKPRYDAIRSLCGCGSGFRIRRPVEALLLHLVEEFEVGLAGLHAAEHEFHGFDFVHRVQELAQNPDLLQFFLVHQQLFTARARAIDID